MTLEMKGPPVERLIAERNEAVALVRRIRNAREPLVTCQENRRRNPTDGLCDLCRFLERLEGGRVGR